MWRPKTAMHQRYGDAKGSFYEHNAFYASMKCCLQEKTELLDNLQELEIAYDTVRTQKKEETKNIDVDLFDQHYLSLKCDMKVRPQADLLRL